MIATTSYVVIDQHWEYYEKWGAGAPRDSLAGIWEVESTDPRWRLVGISRFGWAVIDADDGRRRFQATREGDVVTLVEAGAETEDTIKLTVEELENGKLVLSGDVSATLTPVRGRYTLLLDRGFRWVNEFPFNR